MDIDLLNLDLYCLDPSIQPSYRLYLDEDLLVERNYIWDNATHFLRERCELRLEPGEHKIAIQAQNPEIFVIKNVTLNSKPLEIKPDGLFTKT
jgi:hypothetical protein